MRGRYFDANGVALIDGGGTVVLETHDAIVGPGGQDFLVDGDGIVMVYRAFLHSLIRLGLSLNTTVSLLDYYTTEGRQVNTQIARIMLVITENVFL